MEKVRDIVSPVLDAEDASFYHLNFSSRIDYECKSRSTDALERIAIALENIHADLTADANNNNK